MSRTSIISHAPNQQLVVIRQDYLAICEGNHCAAALLNVFEYWTNIKSGNSEQSKEHNRILEAGGKDATQDVELWIYKSNPELRAELLGLFAETKIRKSLEYLVKHGLITTRNNPNYGWDRTLQYLFMTNAVIAKLHTVKITDGKRKKNVSSVSNLPDAYGKNNGAIPKTTTKTPSKRGKTERERLIEKLEPYKLIAHSVLSLIEPGYDFVSTTPEKYMTVSHLKKYLPHLEELGRLNATCEELKDLHAYLKPGYEKNGWTIGVSTFEEKLQPYRAFKAKANKPAARPAPIIKDTPPPPTDEERAALIAAVANVRPDWEAETA